MKQWRAAAAPAALSRHAQDELRYIAQSPQATQTVNPGVVRKLTDEGFCSIVMLPSPFKTHKGAKIAHLQITDRGRERLEKTTK